MSHYDDHLNYWVHYDTRPNHHERPNDLSEACGKPLTVQITSVRPLASVEDDDDSGDLKEGTCEMCERELLLTFHHLIPKDVHATYLKKRLPRGIEGEPTRGFLNTYGSMICRKCHNMVRGQQLRLSHEIIM